MKKLLLLILIIQFAFIGKSQENLFSKVYTDNGGSAQAYSIIESQDGAYIIAGEKDDGALLMKVDSQGVISWKKQIGNENGKLNSLIELEDMSIISFGILGTPTIIKTSPMGEVLWAKNFSLGGDYASCSIDATSTNGFICSFNLDGSAIIISLLDENGNTIWSHKYISGNHTNRVSSVKAVADGGFIVTGYVEDYPPYNGGSFLLKLNSSGAVEWAKQYNHPNVDHTFSGGVQEAGNGFTVLLTYNGGVTVVKTNNTGEVIWGKDINTYGQTELGELLKKTMDGGFLVTSSSGPYPFENKILKLDSVANIEVAKDLMVHIRAATEKANNDIAVVGNGPLYGVKKQIPDQIGLIIIDSLGNGAECVEHSSHSSEAISITSESRIFSSSDNYTTSNLNLTPSTAQLSVIDGCVGVYGSIQKAEKISNTFISYNKNEQTIAVDVNEDSFNVYLFNICGQRVYESNFNIDNATIDCSHLKDGIYIVKVETKNSIKSQKITIY